MASVNIQKFKSSVNVKAMLRHCDSEKRKETKSHNNEHIDIGKYSFSGFDYKTACENYDKRIEFLDSLSGQNKRKDRVTCLGLSIPVPKDLPEEKYKDWYGETLCVIAGFYGVENVIGVYIHNDEIHEYIDSRTGEKTMSRSHMHCYVVPADKNNKLNAKSVTSRKNLIAINNAVHKMTQEQFQVDFMDGTKRKSKESVESLKRKSEALAEEKAREQKYNTRVRKLDARERALDKRETVLKARENIFDENERELSQKQENLEIGALRASERDDMLSEREQCVTNKENMLSQREQAIERKEQEIQKKEGQIDEFLARAANILNIAVKQGDRVSRARDLESRLGISQPDNVIDFSL